MDERCGTEGCLTSLVSHGPLDIADARSGQTGDHSDKAAETIDA